MSAARLTLATRGRDSSSIVLGWAAKASASSSSRWVISVLSTSIWVNPRTIVSRTFGAMGLAAAGAARSRLMKFGC